MPGLLKADHAPFQRGRQGCKPARADGYGWPKGGARYAILSAFMAG